MATAFHASKPKFAWNVTKKYGQKETGMGLSRMTPSFASFHFGELTSCPGHVTQGHRLRGVEPTTQPNSLGWNRWGRQFRGACSSRARWRWSSTGSRWRGCSAGPGRRTWWAGRRWAPAAGRAAGRRRPHTAERLRRPVQNKEIKTRANEIRRV